MDKYVGKRLDGRYEIKEVIGVGGMAVVYKAYDNVEDKIVAIKILKEEFSTNEEFLRRFKNESKAIAMLSHPNIVKVNDVSFGDLIQYIVMEYIDGITLKQYIEREGSLPWKDAVHFILQVLRGLQHAHDRGIVHRDIKPQNIMVLNDGTIKVTDFGIARFARSEQKTITDKAIGSVHYISPEQARGEFTDEKSDVYSVGVILYEMLTGQLPFQAENAVSVAIMQLQREPSLPTEINGSIPLGLEQITMHAMQKDASRRYKSAAEMLCDLDAFRKDPASTFNYSYFVDNSPTKYIASDNEDEYVDSDDKEKDKLPIIPILAGVAAALVVAAFVVVAVILGWFNKKTEEVDCPNLVGMSLEEVLSSQYAKDYTIDYTNWENNNQYEYGVIFKQSPEAGVGKVKKGNTITVHVSLGTETITMPNVIGERDVVAEKTLNKKGFLHVDIIREENEHVAAGVVFRTDPEPDKPWDPKDTVTIYVSLGSDAPLVNVPNVVGLSAEKAKQDLAEAGFAYKEEPIDNTTYPVGTVAKQSPSPNETTQAPLGSEVIIYVSSGNYSVDISIPLPKDYKYDNGYVELWDGVKGEYSFGEHNPNKNKKKININNYGEDYKFTVVSDKETVTLLVRLSPDGKEYHDYLEIELYPKTNSYSIIGEFGYPVKDATSSDVSSGTNTSSDVSQ
ncbi:MAG: Stk1 family PASTA domain-containing Ser/Thr kinase [Clostridia bacterium]|nr:Stk1 family PASTA domain-containing Ser/Thr kinase [Clostridia bacterium]